MGFTGRKNYHHLHPLVNYSLRPENHPWFRSFRFGTQFSLITDGNGRWAERQNPLSLNVDFHSGDQVSININRTSYERLLRDFRITPAITLPEGSVYRYTRYRFGFNTASRRAIAGNVRVILGSFYTGTRRDIDLGLDLRPRRGLAAALSASFNRVELDEGSFSTKLLRAVVDTTFSPFLSVSNNIQYDTVSRTLGWQLRFRWILEPGNDIYVVWVNNWLDTGEALTRIEGNAAAKLVYSHRF